MKPSVVVTLIIMGSLLTMVPIQSDNLHTREIARVLSQQSVDTVSMDGRLTGLYRGGYWVSGLIVVAAAIIGSFQTPLPSRENHSGS